MIRKILVTKDVTCDETSFCYQPNNEPLGEREDIMMAVPTILLFNIIDQGEITPSLGKCGHSSITTLPKYNVKR